MVREDAQALERKGLKTMKNHEATETTQPAAVAEQGAPVAPAKAASKKVATQKKGAPKGQQTAKGARAKAAAPKKAAKAAKKAAKPERKATAPRAESKGATLAEIMKATGSYALICTRGLYCRPGSGNQSAPIRSLFASARSLAKS